MRPQAVLAGLIVAVSPTRVDATIEAPEPTCFGQAATILGTGADELIIGTDDADVIVGLGGDDVIKGKGGVMI
jgi:hypothetical protein